LAFASPVAGGIFKLMIPIRRAWVFVCCRFSVRPIVVLILVCRRREPFVFFCLVGARC